MDIEKLLSILPRVEYENVNDIPEEFLLRDTIDPKLDQDQDKLFSAILKTIPKESLKEMLKSESLETFGPLKEIREKIWRFSRERPIRERRKNESISILLKLYLDKKSKRVVYARERLRDRFDKQSYREQNRILRAFLAGSVSDCDWAGIVLRDHWRKEMASLVDEVWKRTRNRTLSYVILRHFANNYILREQESLIEVAGYVHVCARVGNEPTFEMDESRLSTPDYLYVMARLGREVDMDEMEKRIYGFLLSYAGNYHERGWRYPSFHSIQGWERMIWAMGELGMQDALVRLMVFVNTVKKNVDNKSLRSIEYAWISFLRIIKKQIDSTGEKRNERIFSDQQSETPFMSLKEEWTMFVDCFYHDKPRLHGLLGNASIQESHGYRAIIIPVHNTSEEKWINMLLDVIRNLFETKTRYQATDYEIRIKRESDGEVLL